MIVPERLRAMIVDDNAYARQLAASILNQLGIGQIEEAAGGAAAIAAMLAQRFDFVLMDWYMPDMNGAAILELVRDLRFPAAARAPVIMMTAYPNRETIARARQLGAREVLTKPFAAAQLATVVGRLLPGGWSADEAEGEPQVFL